MLFYKRIKTILLQLFLAGSFLSIIILILFSGVKMASAGFGISPPTVTAHHLLAGSYFEQIIYLVQGNPEKELKAIVLIEAPEIEKWISVDKGNEFIIPAGIQQFPIKIQLNVPNKTELGDYKGIVRIKTMSSNDKDGQISIALGGRIDLDLKVTEEKIFGFIIKSVNISDIEKDWPVKITFDIKNSGNIESKPTKAVIEIFDKYENDLLISGEFFDFDLIKPFQSKNLIAVLPVDLPVGEYWCNYKLYKDDGLLRQGKNVFNITPKGTIDKSLTSKIKNWIADNIISWFSWIKSLFIIIGLILICGIIWAKKNLKISKK